MTMTVVKWYKEKSIKIKFKKLGASLAKQQVFTQLQFSRLTVFTQFLSAELAKHKRNAKKYF